MAVEDDLRAAQAEISALRAQVASVTGERDTLARDLTSARAAETKAANRAEKAEKSLADAMSEHQAQLTEARNAAETARAAAQAEAQAEIEKVRQQAFEQAVQARATALATQNGMVDASDVSRYLDMSKVKQDDSGAITGLDEQVVELKAAKPYLFATSGAVDTGTTATGIPPKTVNSSVPAVFDARTASAEEVAAFMADRGLTTSSY